VIGIEIWFNPKHWNIIPHYDGCSKVYSVSWLMLYLVVMGETV
jgi:hypothetical protein